MDILDTTIYETDLAEAGLDPGVYIYGQFEERSGHFDPNADSLSHLEFICVIEDDELRTIQVPGFPSMPYNHMGKLKELVTSCIGKNIYIDITGLTHAFWAPLLKLFLEQRNDTHIIYVEPKEYKKSTNPVGGDIYDLSARINGIMPLPGFSSFFADTDEFIFVPILGFEGQRYSFAIENVQPISARTFPVVGVPGYRAEYPFYTYQGNRLPLMDTKSWKNVRYTAANCPYELFDALTMIGNDSPNIPLKIAMLGTKPHSLGAILYRLSRPGSVELIYDHPIRLQKRTEGASTKHVFHVSNFFLNQGFVEEVFVEGRLR